MLTFRRDNCIWLGSVKLLYLEVSRSVTATTWRSLIHYLLAIFRDACIFHHRHSGQSGRRRTRSSFKAGGCQLSSLALFWSSSRCSRAAHVWKQADPSFIDPVVVDGKPIHGRDRTSQGLRSHTDHAPLQRHL